MPTSSPSCTRSGGRDRAPKVPYSIRAEQIEARLSSGPLTAQQIAAALGLRPLCAHRTLRRMLDERRIRIAGRSERDDVRGPKPILYGAAE